MIFFYLNCFAKIKGFLSISVELFFFNNFNHLSEFNKKGILIMGKLIVIEGSDGSGKATQSIRLANKLSNLKFNVKRISFPNYESESSALIKMFLRGDFGSNPENINPYAISLFYAVDRFSSFSQDWKDFYELNNSIIIADRYSGSNMAYQMTKFKFKKDRLKFINWIKNIEFEKLGLPIPDMTIFLDVSPSISAILRKIRGRDDIIESDKPYLNKVYSAYQELSSILNWFKIDCSIGNIPKGILDIENEIFTLVEEHILLDFVKKKLENKK